jgi:hypothetical protein
MNTAEAIALYDQDPSLEWSSSGEFEQINQAWNDIRAKYPLFTGRNIGTQTAPGWWPILEEAFIALTEQAAKLPPGKSVNIVQIKEKFGGLRIYLDIVGTEVGDDFESFYSPMLDIVRAASAKAIHTCEFCGNPGKQESIFGWIKTVCPKHHEQLDAKRRKGFGS